MAKYVWHYANSTTVDYIDLYTASLDDFTLPAKPTYRLVPNVNHYNYVVYRQDGSVAAALYYHQLPIACSLTSYRLDIASPVDELLMTTALTGQFLAYHSSNMISLNTVEGVQPDLVVSFEGAPPFADLSQFDAKRALAKDALGNVTRYVSGHPTPDFNGWQLNPGGVHKITDIAYTYY